MKRVKFYLKFPNNLFKFKGCTASGQWKVSIIFPSGEKNVIVPESKYANRTDFVKPYIPEPPEWKKKGMRDGKR